MFNLNACFFPYAQNCSVLLLIELGGGGGGAGLFCISFSAANFVLRVFLGNCLFILFFSEVELTSRSKHKYCVCDVVSDAVMEDFGWCLDIIGGETQSRVVVDVVTV